MITITQTPDLVCLQGLPIVFKATSNMFDEPFFKIMAEPVAGQRELLKLNSDDEAVFDLREYFKPELSVEFKQTAFVHENCCRQFMIQFSEYYGNPPVPEATTDESINVLLGTVPKWKQHEFRAVYANFAAWLSANIFLSWYPSQPKRVLPDQPEVLYFIAPSSATYSPAVVITYSDGTTASHSPSISIAAQTLEVASLPVGYTALGIAAVNPSKQAVSYTVTIGGKTRSYLVDHTPYNDVRYIIFRTSLGGYDVLACTGEADALSERTAKIAERVYDQLAPERISRYAYNIELKEVETVNTGWLQANEKRWLNDLMISEDVWEMLNGVLSPVMIRNSDLDRTERNYEPGTVEIEYERLNWAQ